MLDHISEMAFQDIFYLFDACIIRFFRLQSFARSEAIFNMIFKTNFVFACSDRLWIEQ